MTRNKPIEFEREKSWLMIWLNIMSNILNIV